MDRRYGFESHADSNGNSIGLRKRCFTCSSVGCRRYAMETEQPKTMMREHRVALLTNHALVLVLIAKNSGSRMRDIAHAIGITERAVQRIVEDLTVSGYIHVTKDGRRNRYEIEKSKSLQHPMEEHCNIGDLLRMVVPGLKAS
jgi:predicted transcriptional regulator